MSYKNVLKITIAAVAIIGLPWLLFHHENYVINATDCLPVGIYQEQPKPVKLQIGDIVEFCPDLSNPVIKFGAGRHWLEKSYGDNACAGGYAPMLKKVAALPGDFVLVTKDGVVINKVLIPHTTMLQKTGSGAVMPNMGYGAYTVPAGQFFAMADNDPAAFDSRYFGTVSTATITYTAEPVITEKPHYPDEFGAENAGT